MTWGVKFYISVSIPCALLPGNGKETVGEMVGELLTFSVAEPDATSGEFFNYSLSGSHHMKRKF